MEKCFLPARNVDDIVTENGYIGNQHLWFDLFVLLPSKSGPIYPSRKSQPIVPPEASARELPRKNTKQESQSGYSDEKCIRTNRDGCRLGFCHGSRSRVDDMVDYSMKG